MHSELLTPQQNLLLAQPRALLLAICSSKRPRSFSSNAVPTAKTGTGQK